MSFVTSYILPTSVSWWNGDNHSPPFLCQIDAAKTFAACFLPSQVASHAPRSLMFQLRLPFQPRQPVATSAFRQLVVFRSMCTKVVFNCAKASTFLGDNRIRLKTTNTTFDLK
jgi:hypothetical protein